MSYFTLKLLNVMMELIVHPPVLVHKHMGPQFTGHELLSVTHSEDTFVPYYHCTILLTLIVFTFPFSFNCDSFPCVH